MSSYPRGICLIVNNVNFQTSHRLPGGVIDEKLVDDLFRAFHFDVVVKRDLTRDEIRATAEEFAAKDHGQYSAFVFYILSHGGSNDVIYGVDERSISVAELVRLFVAANCPSLQGKPKLFFIEACRGRRTRPVSSTEISDSAPSTTPCLPEADFLLAFASTLGYVAHISSNGSWFTRVSLCLNTNQPSITFSLCNGARGYKYRFLELSNRIVQQIFISCCYNNSYQINAQWLMNMLCLLSWNHWLLEQQMNITC